MLKGYFVNFACAILATVSNSLLKQAVKNRINFGDSASSGLLSIFALLRFPTFWVSVIFFVAANVLWLHILSVQTMSVAFPLQVSLVLVMTTFVSVTMFSEPISPSGILGMIFVIVGIVLVSRQ
jgi:multidrug transporter EmrE-like cation transporter